MPPAPHIPPVISVSTSWDMVTAGEPAVTRRHLVYGSSLWALGVHGFRHMCGDTCTVTVAHCPCPLCCPCPSLPSPLTADLVSRLRSAAASCGRRRVPCGLFRAVPFAQERARAKGPHSGHGSPPGHGRGRGWKQDPPLLQSARRPGGLCTPDLHTWASQERPGGEELEVTGRDLPSEQRVGLLGGGGPFSVAPSWTPRCPLPVAAGRGQSLQ